MKGGSDWGWLAQQTAQNDPVSRSQQFAQAAQGAGQAINQAGVAFTQAIKQKQIRQAGSDILGLMEQGQLNEQTHLARLSRKLRDEISRKLFELMRSYDALVAEEKVDEDLGAAIEAAAARARTQLQCGFGKGREQWIEELYNAFPGRPLAARELAFIEARGHVADIFDDIDASLDRAVRRLWSEVAHALNARLGDDLVPGPGDGRAALCALRERAAAQEAEHLPPAIEDLLGLRDDYGSLVLRVTRPRLRKIAAQAPPGSTAPGPSGTLGPAIVGVVADTAANAVGLPPVSPIVQAVWWNRGQQGAAGPPPATQAAGPDDNEANAFCRELSHIVEQCIGQLEEALREEGQKMPAALAAAIDRFWDTACVADYTEKDFERICAPIRNQIWPGEFGGNAAVVAIELSRVADRGRTLVRDIEELRSLGSALRLRPPESTRD